MKTPESLHETGRGITTFEADRKPRSSAGLDVGAADIITAIPLNVRQGSGCYVATRTLVEGLRRLGVCVSMITPRVRTPIFLATRVLFNERLRWRAFHGDATIGIDADGYSIAGRRKSAPHIACIKGVLGDAVRFEKGATRASMEYQARLEAKNAQRADLVITISNYCAERLNELYGVKNAVVVPELIDLEAWSRRLHSNPGSPDPEKFTVLSVCRFYPRKRLDVLLRAAACLRKTILRLEVRIVGNGPEYSHLQQLCGELSIRPIVRWLGDVSAARLAEEYNRAHIFCLPSEQEGFGIVLLEAMAAGKPIVATRSAAIPEVVSSGILVKPDDCDALAEAILHLYRRPDLRDSIGAAGRSDAERFDVNRVAPEFLSEVAKIAPAFKSS